MTRETRINLIFLMALLCLSLPGGVILFKKKLDPTRPPSFMPDGRRDRIAYVDPREAPDLSRYIPPLTGQWVSHLAQERGLDGAAAPNNQPAISQSRRLQFISARQKELHFLYWGTLTGKYQVRVGDELAPWIELAPVEIPNGVRQELIYAGYAQPPKRATWVVAHVRHLPTSGVASLISSDGSTDSVPIFTN